MSSSTLRHRSFDGSLTSGSSYRLILEHLLSYPGTYELPVRTMYTLNSSPRAQPPPLLRTMTNNQDPTKSQHPEQTQQAADSPTAQLTSALISQITLLPSQPCSLPPVFTSSFLRRCFAPELFAVDFPQALTGLDYLKDLDTRRRREAAAALGRLGVDKAALNEDAMTSILPPSVAVWVKAIAESERKVDALYTQLYIGLRRWILINELSLQPFNKHNCLAMLNALYPPRIAEFTPPTLQLKPQFLKEQRDGFFKYIRSVERFGPSVMENLMQQGKRQPSDANGWPAVNETLESYLRVANSLIEECSQMRSVKECGDSSKKRKDRKADSGVSFGIYGRPSTSSSNRSTPGDRGKTLPLPPQRPQTPSRGLSALEKIAREIRRIKMKAGEADVDKENLAPPDDLNDVTAEAAKKALSSRGKVVRKLKSLGDLKTAGSRSTADDEDTRTIRDHFFSEDFDKDEMMRQRLLYEAKSARSRS